jgi:hypothetical protein
MKGISARRNELTGTWWSWAKNEDNFELAPDFLRPLILEEVTRVEAHDDEIAAALAWAESIEGWKPLPPESKPLHVFDMHPNVALKPRPGLVQDDDRR